MKLLRNLRVKRLMIIILVIAISVLSFVTLTRDTSKSKDKTKSEEVDEPVVEEVPVAPNPSASASDIDDVNSLQVVVNKNRSLPSTFIPNNLVNVDCASTKSGANNLLRQEAATAVCTMINSAENEGVNLIVTSPYRSYQRQETLFNSYVAKDGYELASTYSAPPGTSEHQTGLATDIGEINGVYDNFSTDFGLGTGGKWLASNSYKYGFILRYPKGMESITTYQYEPWHFRYVGIDEATKIYNSGLTMEEYYGY